MDRAAAQRLAKDWLDALRMTDACPWEATRSEQAAGAAWSAVFGALCATVPDGTISCTLYREEDAPAVYVLDGKELYEIECDSINEGLNAQARVTKLHLDRRRVPVEIRTSYGEAPGFVRIAIDWEFGLRLDRRLKMSTNIESDDESQPDHVFAIALARALGWSYPESALRE